MRVLPLKPYLETLSDEAQDTVRRHLIQVGIGRMKDFVTPLIPDREDPTSGRIDRISEVSEWLYPTGYDWLDQYEEDQQVKIGPYSLQPSYEDRTPVIYDYYNQPAILVIDDAWNRAIAKVSQLIATESLRPASIETGYNAMPTGTNLGLPFATSNKEYRYLVLETARLVERGGFQHPIDPCMLYFRGQPRNLEETKPRTIWGFPHYITIHEERLQIPMLKVLRQKLEFAAWVGPSRINEAVSFVLDNCKSDVLSVDFSRFDASQTKVAIHTVFDIIRNWFVKSARPLIDYVEKAFLEIGLLTPEGILVERNGGVPSGSGLTNLVDTLLQRLQIEYLTILMDNEIDIHLAQGDDGVVCWKSRWSLDTLVRLAKSLNLTISSDKGGVSRDLVYYLQRIHSKHHEVEGLYPGIYPVMRCLNGAMSYERLHTGWSGEDDTLRWLQQFNNLNAHPKFSRAVQFLYENDKFLREGLSIDDLLEGAGGTERAERVLELKAFPYGKLQLEDYPMSPVWLEVLKLRNR